MKTFEQFTEGSLHKWFKGSKSKDGKPGWVNVKTGGGSKSFGYAKNKSNPVKSKSIGDTGATGHYKKRDQKVTSKSGKTTRYKMKFRDRMDAPVSRRQELKDPKKNPKHTANK